MISLIIHQDAEDDGAGEVVALKELADGFEGFGNGIADGIAGELEAAGYFVVGKALYPAHGKDHFALRRELVDGLGDEVLVFAIE